MKNLTFTILGLIFLLGVFQVKSQNKFASLEENRAFKQKLINEEQLGYNNQVLPQNISKQKSLLAVNDYGDTPDLNWAGQFGGSANDYGRDIVSDDDGNVYITGSFSGEITVASNTLTCIGIRDAIIAMFDNAGNLVWLTQLSSSENESVDAYGICLDDSHNIYVTGYYTGNVTFGTINLTDNAEMNLFYTKLNSSGDVLMAKNHGYADETEIGLKIDADDSGNIYVLGSTDTYTSWRHATIILKFNQSGILLWEQKHDESFNDIVVYNSNIYFAALFEGTNDGIIDDDITLELLQGGYGDAFIAKAELNGDFLWASLAGRTGWFSGNSYGEFLAVDENENIYMAGFFRSDVVFGNDTLYTDYPSNGFIAKCSSSGDFLWARLIATLSSDDVCTDISGNSYVAHSNQITKFDTAGIEQWTEEIDYYLIAITISPSDKLLTTGNLDGLIFLSQLDNTANEEWFVQFEGNSASSYVIGMVTDNTGKVYTYGCTSNTIDYFGEEVTKGIFICKQNGSGEVIWLKQFAEVQMPFGSQGNYLNIDTLTSHIYITGELYDELIIPGEIRLTPAEDGRVFILKYDLDGNYIWHVQEDFKGDEPSVVPDQSGNVILSGTFNNIITIGNTELESAGGRDGFVAKYDENGNFQWAMRAGGESIEYMAITAIDQNDNIYLSGEFISENVTVDDTEITLAEGDGNIIFSKIGTDGDVLWVKSFAASHHEWHDGLCWPTGIKTDAEGNIFIKGSHADSVYFDDILLTSPYYRYSKFITKINPLGNVIWAKSLNQRGGSYWFDYNQFDIDSEGNVYFGMQAKDTMNFGDDFQYIPSGAYDLFVAKYTTNGDLDWVKAMQGNETSNNWISSVAVYDTLNVFVGGFLGNYLSIDDEELTSTNRHGFVTMFGDDISGVKEVYNRNNKQFDIYPNPSNGLVTFNSNFKLNNKIEILNVTGQIVHTVNITSKNQQIDLRNLSNGLYFIKVSNDKYFKTEKLIIE